MSAYMNALGKSKERKNDIYYTPTDLAKEIIKICDVKTGDTILDPFKGGGAFYDNYPEGCPKEWCEIEQGKDFFDYDGKVDWIISNPPFSIVAPVFEKTVEVAQKGFCYILGVNNLTPKRMKIAKDKGFELTRWETFNVKSWHGFQCCFVIFEKDKPSYKLLSKDVYSNESSKTPRPT